MQRICMSYVVKCDAILKVNKYQTEGEQTAQQSKHVSMKKTLECK